MRLFPWRGAFREPISPCGATAVTFPYSNKNKTPLCWHFQGSPRLQRITELHVGYGNHASCLGTHARLLLRNSEFDACVCNGFDDCPERAVVVIRFRPGTEEILESAAKDIARRQGKTEAAGQVPASQDNNLQPVQRHCVPAQRFFPQCGTPALVGRRYRGRKHWRTRRVYARGDERI